LSRQRGRRHSWNAVAARLLLAALPEDADDPATWDRCALLLPHAQAVADRAQPATVITAFLRQWCGWYLRARGEFGPARDMYEQALAIHRRVLSDEHPDTLTSMNNLALVLHDQGD